MLIACSSVIIQSEDKNIVIGRTMDLAISPGWTMYVCPKETHRTTYLPDKKPGISWTSRYTHFGIYGKLAFSGGHLYTGCISDGINEKGLSLECHILQGTYYPEPSSANLAAGDFAFWVLENFEHIDTLKKELKNIRLWSENYLVFENDPAPLHYAITDSQGGRIIVEFLKEGMSIIDDQVGIFTNAPDYTYHLKHCEDFLALSPMDAPERLIDGHLFKTPSHGSGLFGMPGDYSSTSRFIRLWLLKQFSNKARNDKEAEILATHLMNNVDIPEGTVTFKLKNTITMKNYTQWTILKSLNQHRWFIKRYEDLNYHFVDLNQIWKTKFTKEIHIPLTEINHFDITDLFNA
jgi:choloylglycine hydrolase